MGVMFCMLDQRQSTDDHSRSNMSTAMLQKLKMKPKHHGMILRHFGTPHTHSPKWTC